MAKITMHFFNERMRWLIAAELLPERAGQPVKAECRVRLGWPGRFGRVRGRVPSDGTARCESVPARTGSM